MGARIRGVVVVGAVLMVGAFLGSALSQWSRDGERTSSSPGGGATGPGAAGDAVVGNERVRVEILNGAGRSGMARSATERLRDRGFDVVYFGNADSFDHDSSRVVDRVDRPELARRVADALGIGRVVSEPDSNLFLDVTVVLGGDWREGGGAARPGEPGPGSAPTASTTAWWDLRRFLPPYGGDGEGGDVRSGSDRTERMTNPGADSVARDDPRRGDRGGGGQDTH